MGVWCECVCGGVCGVCVCVWGVCLCVWCVFMYVCARTMCLHFFNLVQQTQVFLFLFLCFVVYKLRIFLYSVPYLSVYAVQWSSSTQHAFCYITGSSSSPVRHIYTTTSNDTHFQPHYFLFLDPPRGLVVRVSNY